MFPDLRVAPHLVGKVVIIKYCLVMTTFNFFSFVIDIVFCDICESWWKLAILVCVMHHKLETLFCRNSFVSSCLHLFLPWSCSWNYGIMFSVCFWKRISLLTKFSYQFVFLRYCEILHDSFIQIVFTHVIKTITMVGMPQYWCTIM